MTSTKRWIRVSALGMGALLTLGFAVGSLAGSGTADHAAGVVPAAAREDGAAMSALAGPPDPLGKSAAGAAPEESLQDGTTDLTAPGFGDRVIRESRLTIEVPEDGFDDAWTKAMRIAAEIGGEVVSAQRGTDVPQPLTEDLRSTPFGTITIRVPSSQLDAAAARMRAGLGEVRHEMTDSQDVSEEYVDLRARLRNLRTEEAALLDLFARANSVRDTLAVRERLSQVRGEIEQVSGRIRFIESRTEFSTLTLTIAEPGGIIAPPPGDDPSFARAWETALEGLVRIGSAAMIAAVWLTPFALLAAAVLALRRRGPAAPQH